MRSSYSKEDVIFLLKDITGLVEPLPASRREVLIQSGLHYCEMLPCEYEPTEEYMETYREALETFGPAVASAVGTLSDEILRRRGNEVVLVSLARAGTPVGILIKRYLKYKYGLDVPHYSISIIRGRGIDDNAMRYLLDRYAPESLLFLDGWIGKGAILRQLAEAVGTYEGVSPQIAVVADPANETELCGTHEDILIPSCCLGSTVSGLISRTFLRSDIIGPGDFHGAAWYGELSDRDLSYDFIQSIEKHFARDNPPVRAGRPGRGLDEVKELARIYSVRDINLIKPGIGETTRVLLRRIPWKVLADEKYTDSPQLRHIIRLAKEKGVPVEHRRLDHYLCCGIIKDLSDI